MMQAGRELDAKVTEALGWDSIGEENGNYAGHFKDTWAVIPAYSTTWYGMGVLVEEARKQGVYLEYEHFRDGRYMGRAWKCCDGSDDWLSMPRDSAIIPPTTESAPRAVCLAFLKAKGVEVNGQA